MMTSRTTLYQQVVEVTADILGPAAERFVARQIENHLNKPPEKLTRSDLEALVDWIKLAISMLTDDQSLVDAYGKRILELAKKR